MTTPIVRGFFILLGLSVMLGCQKNDTTALAAPLSVQSIAIQIEIVDHLELSTQNAYIRAKLTETNIATNETVTRSSLVMRHLHPLPIKLSLSGPSNISDQVNYGIAIELNTGTDRPSFNAWYPIDLKHYDGSPLKTRLFPSDSSTMINYQIASYTCDDLNVEMGTDNHSLWLNIDGRGYFLERTEGRQFSSDYVQFELDLLRLSIGEQTYSCTSNKQRYRMAKQRFKGVQLRGINREQGWIISIYENQLEYLTNRGFTSVILPLTASANLIGDWQVTADNGMIVRKSSSTECANGLMPIDVIADGSTLSTCAQQLR